MQKHEQISLPLLIMIVAVRHYVIVNTVLTILVAVQISYRCNCCDAHYTLRRF